MTCFKIFFIWSHSFICIGDLCKYLPPSECYGIPSQFSTLDGWLCQRCTLGAGNERCRLCPFGDGALNKTDNGVWAHILCAQYIPEVLLCTALLYSSFIELLTWIDFEMLKVSSTIWSVLVQKIIKWRSSVIDCHPNVWTVESTYFLFLKPLSDHHWFIRKYQSKIPWYKKVKKMFHQC